MSLTAIKTIFVMLALSVLAFSQGGTATGVRHGASLPVAGKNQVFDTWTYGLVNPKGTFFALNGGNTGGSEVTVQNGLPKAMTATAMYVSMSVAVPASSTVVATLRKNGADTALTCTVGAAAFNCNITGQSVSYVAGDLIDYHTTITGSAASTNIAFHLVYQ